MRILQFVSIHNERHLGLVDGDKIRLLDQVSTTIELCHQSWKQNATLTQTINGLVSDKSEAYETILTEKRLRVPLDHADPYHTWLTGTGLTHLGSAASRGSMHRNQAAAEPADATDSMKMFRMGLEGGKMKGTQPGVQPEWFYKGNGLNIVHPEQPLIKPGFALDGGEEPELVGLYLIDPAGVPKRIGFALGNEFSDHKMEKINYLYLAHSKLRSCSYGPELLIDPLPAEVQGVSRIRRGNSIVWQKEFITGEGAMSHNFANLEYHHFKYPMFRQPGDVHVHFFGTSILSFSDQFVPEDGDLFEIESPLFGRPLRNPLKAQ